MTTVNAACDNTRRRCSFNAHSGPVAVYGTVATYVAMHLDELQVEIRWFVNEIKHSPARTVSRRKPLPSVTVLAVFFFSESRHQDYETTNLEVKRLYI